ncbi:MAG: hypothetical protein LUG88_04035 [Clostridia bacterium]|nr:hypothetical protein [Clostridia bacterium]
MAFFLLIIAAIFLAVPDFSLLDFLPDFIAIFAVWFALRRCALFSTRLEEARSVLFKVGFIALADAIVSYALLSSSDTTMVLLEVACFGVIEAYMLIKATSYIFDGLTFVGTEFECTGIYFCPSEKRIERRYKRLRKKCDRLEANGKDYRAWEIYHRGEEKILKYKNGGAYRAQRLCTVFFIARAVLKILPELTALSSYAYSGEVTAYSVDIADYRGLFVLLAFALSAIFGLVWFFGIMKCIISVMRDKKFVADLRERSSTKSYTHGSLAMFKHVRFSMWILIIAFVLSLDAVFDYVNYTPDFLAAAAFLFFWLSLSKSEGGKMKPLGILSSVIYGGTSAFLWIFLRNYISRYGDYTKTMSYPEAYNGYVEACVITAVNEIFFVAAVILIVRQLRLIIDEHTGFVSDESEHDVYTVNLHAELTARVNKIPILALITAAGSVAYQICVGILEIVPVSSEDGTVSFMYIPTMDWMGILSVALSLVFIFYSVKQCSDIIDGAEERYKLD